MSDLVLYKRMYSELFHAITGTTFALEAVYMDLRDMADAQKAQVFEEQIELAVLNLRKAQQKTEQIYIEGET